MIKFLKGLFAKGKPSPLHRLPSPQRAEIERLIAELRCKKLTYVGKRKLSLLAWAVLQIGKENVKGDVIEAGVALGGSAILLAKLKPKMAGLVLFDVFGLIPPPGEMDGEDAHKRYSIIASGRSDGIGDDGYYGYMEDLMAVVQRNLANFGVTAESHGVRLVRGLYQDSLHVSGTVALAHIDCDWYDSVKICIERIYPHLSAGGYLVFDDYQSYSGCRRAVDEWVVSEPTACIVLADKSVVVQKQN